MEYKDRIKLLRVDSGLTQTDLASKFGKTESAVRSWELGRSKPDVDTLIGLAEYFECTTDYLLGLSDNKNAETAKMMEDVQARLSDSMAKMPDRYRLVLYNAFTEVVDAYLTLHISPDLQVVYWANLTNILRNLAAFASPIPTLFDIQKDGVKVADAKTILAFAEETPKFILDVSHGIQLSVTGLTNNFLRVIDFICHGKVNGVKSVKTTMSELIEELARTDKENSVDAEKEE